jgi:hypothetical protein
MTMVASWRDHRQRAGTAAAARLDIAPIIMVKIEISVSKKPTICS